MNFAVVHKSVQHNRAKTGKNKPGAAGKENKHCKEGPAEQYQETKTRAAAGQYVFNEALTDLEKDLHLEIVDPGRAENAVEANEDAPAIEGLLKKKAATILGFGPTVWHNRYFLLDPFEGSLSYWEAGYVEQLGSYIDRQTGVLHFERPERPQCAPKHTLMLKDIIQVESNHRHNMIQVVFCKAGQQRVAGKTFHLQAGSRPEFDNWVKALQPYGMRQGPKTPTRKKAKARA